MPQVRVSGLGLLAVPLVGHRPAEQLLHMTSHIHGVLEIKVPIGIQHAVSPDRTAAKMVNGKQCYSIIMDGLHS